MATKKANPDMSQIKEKDTPENSHKIFSGIEDDWSVFAKAVEEQRKVEQARIYAELYEPFPSEVERVLSKGGTSLIYIPVSEVINRLNRVLGISGWSSEILRCERDSLDPEFIVAHVRLVVNISDGQYVTKDGFGGQKIKRTKNGEILDLGNEFKSAVSDALKKAAQHLGVGLYLSRTEDAIIIEAQHDMLEEMSPEAKKVNEMYKNFMSLREQLDEAGLDSVRTFWKDWSGGRSVPKPSEFKLNELEALITHVTKILLGGEEVDAD